MFTIRTVKHETILQLPDKHPPLPLREVSQIFHMVRRITFLSKIFLSQTFVNPPSVTKTYIKTFKKHLVRYLILLRYYFSHNTVFLSVLVYKSHDFSYQYQEQATPTPNIGFSKVFFRLQGWLDNFNGQILNIQCFSGYERFYDDVDAKRETIVHIRECSRIFRPLNGK
jgi:hypothetical protein